MRTGWWTLVGLGALAVVAFAGVAAGAEGEGPPAATSNPGPGAALPHGVGPLARLCRGLANVALSPLEVPATMLRVGGEHNAFFGIWAGGLEGLGNGLVRLSAGVLEALTAPVPSDGLPLYNKRLGERALPPLRPPTDITRQ